MRVALSVIFVVLILTLGACTFFASKSRKSIGKTVGMLVASLIPPVAGNLFIIASPVEGLSLTGAYLYIIGMDLVMTALIRFTFEYCSIAKGRKITKIICYSILLLDAIQLLVNIFTHHAFTLELISVDASDYYRIVPSVGLWIHRVIDYIILAGVLITFILKSILSNRVYSEKYLVILLVMILVAGWQTFYIFSRTPMDYSMIGFAIFGVLVFVLSIYYRPLRLLDRMLASLASRMSEALFFFDNNNHCIWINNKANEILKMNEDDSLESVNEKLEDLIGDFTSKDYEWNSNYQKGEGENILSYAIEKHAVIDHKNRVVGSYISLRDDTLMQKDLKRETYNATHDALTKVYNRAGYDSLMDSVDLSKCFLLLLDIDSFKETNDEYGHTTGDQVLVKIAEVIQSHFREDDYVCRIGGDEFAIIIENSNSKTSNEVKKRIDNINEELSKNNKDNLPSSSISAGGAYGKDAEDIYELFNNADHALYETKFGGKRGYTEYTNR